MQDAPPRHDPAADGNIGQLIARRRRQLGKTQRDLANDLCAKSGRPTLTRHEISRYERGLRLPASPLLTAIADTLNLPVAALRLAAATDRERRHTDGRQ